MFVLRGKRFAGELVISSASYRQRWPRCPYYFQLAAARRQSAVQLAFPTDLSIDRRQLLL